MNNKAFGTTRFLPKGLLILHEDKDLIVIHKPNGLLSISLNNGNDRQKTAYSALTDYVKKGAAKSRNRIFIVHRLDRDTSGVMIFAKTPNAKKSLQDNWESNVKKYLAVVHGEMKEKESVLSCYLTENKELRVYATGDRKKGKLAKTKYKVIKVAKKYSLLNIELLTGRRNQIRVQLADSGHPVAGDKKYGANATVRGVGKGKRRIDSKELALHAYKLTCNHPFSGKRMTFISPSPLFFDSLLGKHDSDPSRRGGQGAGAKGQKRGGLRAKGGNLKAEN